MRLLIIEDENELAADIILYLRQEKYICDRAINSRDALNRIEVQDYDCILLDINLPDGSGLKILQELKQKKKDEGVIIISANSSVTDRIAGLKLGADDYLAKPFHHSELAARIEAIIRRKQHSGHTIISWNEISIDTQSGEVSIHGRPAELTLKEYQLLLFLVANPKKVIPRAALINHLWSEDLGSMDRFDFIYTHIKNLRKKLQQSGSKDYIKTVYGIGYKLTDK